MKTFSINDGILLPAEFIASPNFGKRPPPYDNHSNICLIVIHNISLPPTDFSDSKAGKKSQKIARTDKNGTHYVKAFFQNQLNPDDHPYFATIYQLQVSAHLFIERDGTITQFVNFNDRAWHAGKSSYLGMENCNDYSIGIELEGDDFSAFTEIQYEMLAKIIRALNQAYPKTKNHLAGHSDIARGRKSDPGLGFDWQKLRKMI